MAVPSRTAKYWGIVSERISFQGLFSDLLAPIFFFSEPASESLATTCTVAESESSVSQLIVSETLLFENLFSLDVLSLRVFFTRLFLP